MRERGLTQTALAKRSGVDRSDLNRIINGHRSPRAPEVPLLAAVLGVSAEELLAGVELSDSYPRELEQVNDVALRLLEAESERNEALARAEQNLRSLQEAGRALDQERETFTKERERMTARVAEISQEKAQVERELAGVRAELFTAANKVSEQDATIVALRSEIATLQQRLAQENSAKVLTGVLSGFAGLAVGTIVGRMPDAPDEPDDTDD